MANGCDDLIPTLYASENTPGREALRSRRRPVMRNPYTAVTVEPVNVLKSTAFTFPWMKPFTGLDPKDLFKKCHDHT